MSSPILERIAENVRQRADAPAIRELVAPYRTMTYEQVWDLSAGVAGSLSHARGERGVLLGLDRSAELVVAILGSLRAGIPFCLLDPSAPPQRHEAIAMTLGCDRVFTDITQDSWDFGSLAVVTDNVTSTERSASIEESSVAYFASTSGSTGIPKLIEVSHRNVSTFVNDRRLCVVEFGKSIASISSPLSDATIMETLKPLVGGGRIVVTPHPLAIDLQEWPAMIAEAELTHLFLFSPLLEMLGREDPYFLRGVETLIFGGDRIDPDVIAQIIRHSRPKRVVQGYGPTEVTVFGAAFEIPHAQDLRNLRFIPLGDPLEGYEMSLIDADGKVVNGAGRGEILFEGPGVANGYVNADNNAFSQGGFGNRFMTGDMAERTEQGALIFGGRKDRQIKHRGVRIEVEGVEHLLSHQYPNGSFVVGLTSSRAQPQLICFYVVRESSVDPADMSSWLRTVLPSASVPVIWRELESLPLTDLGKIDRRRILSMDGGEND